MKNGPIILAIFGICAFSTFAQQAHFTVSTKPVVAVGETFALTYTLDAQGVNFREPRITGFEVLSGPNTSTSSSIRSINGRTSISITYTYTYLLQALKEGSFEITPASVVVDGKSYQSDPALIKVVAGAGTTSQPQGRPGQQGQQVPEEGRSGGDDVFLKAFASDDNPFQGEGITVTYKIFTKVRLGNLSISKNPSFQGFWSQNLLKEGDQGAQYNQTINGEAYTVAELRKMVLYPLKSGKLTINPMEMECIAQVKRQSRPGTGDPFFDDFFNNSFFSQSYATVEKTLKSNPLSIDVKPLPLEGRPADFSGSVGSFTFRSELDKTTVKANEPVTLKFIVAGTGNIQLIDRLDVSFPPDFETYDPKVVSDFNTTTSGISGMQSFEYLIIPRKPGKFSIKPVPFTYFDLGRKTYITLLSPEYTLNVEKGTGATTGMTYSGVGKEEIQYIGSDIRHIETRPFLLYRGSMWFLGTVSYFLWMGVPLVLFFIVAILFKKQAARRRDTLLMKNRRATRVARKRLRKAEHFLKQGDKDPFYEEISQTLWGYMGDKFGISNAELSLDSVREALQEKNLDTGITGSFIAALQETEFTRFAPGDKILRMEEVYTNAMELIAKTERSLK
jgi:hypothetical protein